MSVVSKVSSQNNQQKLALLTVLERHVVQLNISIQLDPQLLAQQAEAFNDMDGDLRKV